MAVWQPSHSQWAHAVEVRSRALLTGGHAAEDLYQEAISQLRPTQMTVEFARAHLVYGEWLRREDRRIDAREQLHTAHQMFASMGADGFADRALVADAFFSKTEPGVTARLLTSDKRVVNAMARLATPPIDPSKVGGYPSILATYGKTGFNVTIESRTITIIPVP